MKLISIWVELILQIVLIVAIGIDNTKVNKTGDTMNITTPLIINENLPNPSPTTQPVLWYKT